MVARHPEGMASSRARSVLFDVCVSAGVAALALEPLLRRHRPDLAAIGFGMAAVLLFRRRRPGSVMVVVGVLALVELLAFPPTLDPQPYNAGVLIALYSLVKYGDRRWPAITAAGGVGALVTAEAIRHDRMADGISYALLCAGAWLSGYVVRTRRLYVASLEERAVTAERERDHLARIAVAEERAVIARELHDVVAHSLAVMIVQADGANYAIDRDPAQAREAIRQVASTGREALDDMRRMVGVLRGPGAVSVADVDDDTADLRRGSIEDLDPLVERAIGAGLTVNVTTTGDRGDLPHAVDLTLYRIVQEALTNVLRHAGPGAEVELSVAYTGDAVEVSVTDDGGGTPPGAPGPGGHGLVGMRERVAVHGGSLFAGPYGHEGWRVAVRLPRGKVGAA